MNTPAPPVSVSVMSAAGPSGRATVVGGAAVVSVSAGAVGPAAFVPLVSPLVAVLVGVVESGIGSSFVVALVVASVGRPEVASSAFPPQAATTTSATTTIAGAIHRFLTIVLS